MTKEQQLEDVAVKYDMAAKKALEIIPIIKSFDGKMYNKRFNEALRPFYCTASIKEEFLYIDCNANLDYGYFRLSLCSCEHINKRINASLIVNKLKAKSEHLQNYAVQIRKEILQIDTVIAEVNSHIEAINELLSSMSTHARDIYQYSFDYCKLPR